MPQTRRRRGYLDWMRGLAVLVMIEAHVIDSWTRVDARHTWQFMWAMVLGGFGAPLFLFLAGVSVALSAGSRVRRTGDAGAAARFVIMRGWWVFGLAFAFRVQSWILGMGSPRTLLKVDILNIMGPAIVAAAAVWGLCRTVRSRAFAFAGAALAIAFLTPVVRHLPILDAWPEALAAYVRPVNGRSNFCLFPWAGFVFAGAFAGVLIDQAQTRSAEARLNGRLFAWGTAIAAAAYGASLLPSLYAHSEFWGGSPAFFFLRAGVITLLVAMAFAWDARRAWFRERAAGTDSEAPPERWSPMQQLGRSSLFIYWIHVEIVYGLISLRIHKRLTHPEAWMALAAFIVFMLGCAALKDWVVSRRQDRNAAPPPAAPAFAVQ
jgi:uncharacterized membrane protein